MLGMYSLIFTPLVIIITLVIALPSHKEGSLRKSVAEKIDKRVTLMNDMIHGIKIIKLYVWEESFIKIINKLRKNEIFQYIRIFILKNFRYSLYMAVTQILLLLMFVIHGKFTNNANLLSAKAYTIIAFIQATGLAFCSYTPDSYVSCLNMFKCAERIIVSKLLINRRKV